MCFISFRRVVSVMMILFYIFAVIGTELLKYSQEEYDALINDENSNLAYYESGTYGNFTTFEDSIFGLFQILTESSWHLMVLYHEEFHGFWKPCLFLLPFHMIVTFILRSILLGLTWEVFSIVNKSDDYLVNTIKVDNEFKDEFDDDEYSNAR